MRGTRSEAARVEVAAESTVWSRTRGNGDDWAAGYEEGKRVHEAAAGEYRTAGDFLKATAEGLGHSHAWIDGFKSGWSVARDDWRVSPADRLAG